MSTKSVLILLLFISFNSIYLANSQLNGRCGYPGKPYKAKLEPDNKLQYDEGEEVTIQCTDFWMAVQTRKCEKGKWTGLQPRCGDFVSGILMKDSKMEDIEEPDKPKLIFKHINMNITNTTWKYPNVFTSNRFKEARLRVFDTHRYKWSFNFTGPAVKLFVRIMFNFINYTLLEPEVRDNFTFNISVNVSPNRNCVLIQQIGDKWRENGQKLDIDFICESLSHEDWERDIETPGDYLYMETQASIDIPHDLIGVFFGKSYGTEDDPICGEPEFTTAQLSRFNVQYKDYIIHCKKDKFVYDSNTNDFLPETLKHKFICGPDMKWNGIYPDCLPKSSCSIASLLTANKDQNKTVITSMDGLYFFNQSNYYAIDGTEVTYGCTDPINDMLRGKENRECLKTGLWSGAEPHCINETSKLPVSLVIGILFIALISIVCLTGVLFYVYTKRMRNRIADQLENQRKADNDIYDDIDLTGDKTYNMYDVVDGEGGDVRYAATYSGGYYYPEQDYVQIHTNNQSGNNYCNIPPKAEPPMYLDMNYAKKSPFPSPKVSPKSDHP